MSSNRLIPVVFAVVLLTLPLAAADSGAPTNPLFEKLRTEGVAIDSEQKVKLPAPVMADGLDAKGQQAVLAKLAGESYTVEDLLRKSVVAPHILDKHEIRSADPARPVFAVDVYFVAHGGLDAITRKNFLETWQNTQKDRKVHLLTPEELSRRKLEVRSTDRLQQRYSHIVVDVLDRVRVSATLQTVLTRGMDSVLSASRLAPHFLDDPDFPDRWQALTRDDEGKLVVGKPTPYTGAAAYVKVTRLAEPEGTLFVEYHGVYTEPKAWFSGANPLRSKLPAIVQSEVRDFRRALARAQK
jgi:hypothetical protein